jgi:hypothetical protein
MRIEEMASPAGLEPETLYANKGFAGWLEQNWNTFKILQHQKVSQKQICALQ